jgi:vacuolar-type H+-ATPase subunit H
LFTKEEFELEISKTRKKLVKELEDDIITERAKVINEAAKEIERTLSVLDDGTKKGIDIETAKTEIRKSLTNISNSLFSEPEATKAV